MIEENKYDRVARKAKEYAKLYKRSKYVPRIRKIKIKKILTQEQLEKKRIDHNEYVKKYQKFRLKNNRDDVLTYYRNRYEVNKEKHKIVTKKYALENKEKITNMYKRYRKTFPEKYETRGVFNAAKKSGDIVVLPCEVCGNEKTHGHHDDYNYPLKVRWLCPKHHAKFHRENYYDGKTYTYIKK